MCFLKLSPRKNWSYAVWWLDTIRNCLFSLHFSIFIWYLILHNNETKGASRFLKKVCLFLIHFAFFFFFFFSIIIFFQKMNNWNKSSIIILPQNTKKCNETGVKGAPKGGIIYNSDQMLTFYSYIWWWKQQKASNFGCSLHLYYK